VSRRPAPRLEALEDRTVLSFAAPTAFSLPAAPQAVATGHFEGNHAPADVVSANANGVVSVFLGKGDGTLQNPVNIHVGGDPTSVAVGDLLGNGVQDIVTANSNGTVNVVLSNGTFAAPVALTPGTSSDIVAAGDFNGDGKPDLLLIDRYGHTVSVLLNNGNGTFAGPHTSHLNNSIVGFNGQAQGDFFGDGKLSVAVLTGDGSVSVLRGNGDGTFQAPVAYLTDPHDISRAEGVIAADFTGTGKLDLASSSLTNNTVSILLNNSPKPVVGNTATTTTLSTDVNPAVSFQPTLLTASVASSGGTPTGTVNFFDGSTLLGQAAVGPNGQASLLVTLGAGNHALKAVFAGTTPFTASTSAVVTETVHKDATAISFGVSHLGGSAFEAAVSLTPDAPGGGVPSGAITIFDGTKALATAPANTTQLLIRLGAGKHSLTASYSGDADFLASVSAPVVFTF
jgi:hypothetical protein